MVDRRDQLEHDFVSAARSEEELFRMMQQWANDRNADLPFQTLHSPSFHSKPTFMSNSERRSSIPDNMIGLLQYAILQLKNKNKKFKEQIKLIDVEPVNIKALERIEQQLEEEAVFLSFLGRYNSGKTTLINALIGIEVLPVSDRPETATTLYIQNDDKSQLHSDVRLIHSKRNEASGVSNVREYLESMHSGIRKKSKMMVDNYVMKITFPAIESEKPKAYVVDTPGSNEVGESQLQQLADIVLRTASAYIYVMTYSDIKNKEDYNALRDIYERDGEIFYGERLTIVVTHFDRFYESGGPTSIKKEEIKAIVASTIKSEIGADISPDIVFPVAGKWACKVRTFLRTHSTSDFNDVEMGMVNVLRVEKPGKGSKEYFETVMDMGKENVAKKLEDVSGILQLEKRISSITRRLSEIWKRNILTGCNGFLQTAIKIFQSGETSLNAMIKNTEDRIKSAKEVIGYHKEMTNSVTRSSNVYSSLRTAFNDDTSYEKLYQPTVDDLLSRLKRTIRNHRKEKRIYTVEDLDKDVNDEFIQEAERKMTDLFHKTKFFRCQRQLRLHTQRVSEKFGRLRAAANFVVAGDVRAPSIGKFLRGDANGTEDEELAQALDVARTLEEIDLRSIVKVSFSKKIALWTVPWPFSIEVVKDEDIERVITDRRLKLQELHREFIDSICSDVMLYFFKAYCQIVVKELRIFRETYEENNSHVFEQLQAQNREIAGQQRNKEWLLNSIEEFKILQSRLKTFM